MSMNGTLDIQALIEVENGHETCYLTWWRCPVKEQGGAAQGLNTGPSLLPARMEALPASWQGAKG